MIHSNIPKRPTLLAAAGLVVALVLGFALSPTMAFAKPACKKNCDPGGDDATYSVDIMMESPLFGGLAGMSVAPWTESGKLIEPTVVLDEAGHLVDLGELTSLSFFTVRGDPFILDHGSSCFDDDQSNPQTIQLTGGFLQRGRRGRAEGWFWFDASTFEALPDGSEPTPRYLLRMLGTFDGDWPPTNSTTMVLTDWELKIEQPEADVESISCIGEGPQGNDVFEVEIEVTLCSEAQPCPAS